MLKDDYLKKVDKTKMHNIRLTDEEQEKIKKKADTYTEGNVSAWMRFASTELTPPKKYLKK